MATIDTPQPAVPGDAEARARLLALINANWTTQAISAAVQLCLPDALNDGPQTAQALAQRLGCEASSLSRLLRALTSLDILSQDERERYALTQIGSLLRSDEPGSLAPWAEYCGTHSWASWGQLAQCVRSGQSVRRRTRGADGFGHLEEDSAAALLFNRAMSALTRPVAAALVREVDLAGVERVVDVGGGFGELLAAVLQAHPAMRGVLLDLAHATRAAGARLAAAGVAERCEVVTGSFFDAVPAGAEAYLLKSVLHDWDDEHCAMILARCAQAMKSGAKLLVIERMMPERFSVSPPDQAVARSDLNMLVGPGGRERTHAQYRTLLQRAGLRATDLLALGGGFSVLVALGEP